MIIIRYLEQGHSLIKLNPIPLQTLEPLPTRQNVAELPDINWKSYTDSVERIVRQHSSVYQRTRRKGLNKEAATLTKIVGT